MVLTEDRHLVALHDRREGEQILLHVAIQPINDSKAHENIKDLTAYPDGGCPPNPPGGGGPYPPG